MRFIKALLLAVVLVLGASHPAAAAVTVNANTSASCSGASPLNCSNLTVAAGTNTVLVCAVTASVAATSPVVKWDNAGTPQTMTLITGATTSGAGFGAAQLYGLVAPHTGAAQANYTWVGGGNGYIGCTAYDGADQTGGATTFPNGTSATGTSTTTSVTITSAVGNIVEAVHTNLTLTSSCSAIQLWLNTAGAQDSCANRGVGAATTTMTSSIGSSNWGAAGADIKAAAAAGVVCGKGLLLHAGC